MLIYCLRWQKYNSNICCRIQAGKTNHQRTDGETWNEVVQDTKYNVVFVKLCVYDMSCLSRQSFVIQWNWSVTGIRMLDCRNYVANYDFRKLTDNSYQTAVDNWHVAVRDLSNLLKASGLDTRPQITALIHQMQSLTWGREYSHLGKQSSME